jgi:uncharacterized damage-inducible protein DinB
MTSPTWQDIVASSLDWDQAHVSLDSAIAGLTAEARGRRPAGYPHSVWQLLEHIRLAQHDLLDFCINPNYSHDLAWPDDYWPKAPAPPSDEAWEASIEQIKRDRAHLVRFTTEGSVDLTAAIPHGTGQTYLRTIIVAVDHAAYHVGQIVDVRRLNGDWAPA